MVGHRTGSQFVHGEELGLVLADVLRSQAIGRAVEVLGEPLDDLLTLLFDMAVPAAICTMVLAGIALRQEGGVNFQAGGRFLGFLKGAGDSIILGLVSVFYALAIALIPFIAKKIISGDVGSTAFALVRAGGVAAGAALAGVSGFAAGASSASAGATASGGVGASSTSTVLASSTAPPTPSMPDFIRSGVAGAMNSNSSPAVHASNASSNESSGKRDLAAAMSGGSGRHGSSYRPHSVTQVVSFNVGRALGRAAGRNNAENN
jgi:hypothetical protein